jgi:cathepsin L
MQKFILAIVTSIAIVTGIAYITQDKNLSQNNVRLLTKSPIESTWIQWKQQNGKAYGTNSEGTYRFKVFSDNYQNIQSHNSNSTSKYQLGLNKFSDLTADEFTAQYLKYKPDESFQKMHNLLSKQQKKASNLNVASQVDWRSSLVTRVKDQGHCGSCWAFSTTGALEGANAKKNMDLTELSEQQFLDCSGSGCSGGSPMFAIMYAQDNGVTKESDYSYLGTDGHACRYTSGDSHFKPTGYQFVDASDSGLQQAAAIQPVSVAINGSLLQSYTGGVFDHWDCSAQLNHAVLVVGYTSDYWIVKNSWGSGWGESGYFRFERRSYGVGMCGITESAIYPTA